MTIPSLPPTYDFVAPRQIHFGWGRRREVGQLAKSLGRRAFLVTGSRVLERNGVLGELETLLRQAGMESVRVASISREPLVEDVDQTVSAMKEFHVSTDDVVIALGGGSAIDLAKAVAAIVTQPASGLPTENGANISKSETRDAGQVTVRDYLEGVGRGFQLVASPLPVIAIPTTAGTGSEATKNAVISNRDPLFKKSLRAEAMIPRIVVADPELTLSLPPTTTAYSGMDAITQLIESYISCRSQPIPQALCLQGLEYAIPAIVEAVEQGTSRPAREAMMHAAMLSGMALANSGLGLAHGVAAALGVHCEIPHGLACAVMLPAALHANREVSAERIARLAPLLTGQRRSSLGDVGTAVDAAIQSIEHLCRRVGIPATLGELGVTKSQIPQLVSGSHGNSLNGNPRKIEDAELAQILESML